MGQLQIILTVPLSERADRTGAPLMFYCWLPMGRDQGIKYHKDTYHLLLWLDENCTTWAPGAAAEDISNWANVTVYRIYADVTVDNVEDDLIGYMQNRDFTTMPTPEEQPLADRYEEHGRAVLSVLREGLNHLLSFARSEKGQYWLTPYHIDFDNTGSHATEFRTKARVGDGDWFRWNPSQVLRGKTIMIGKDARYLTADDWPQAMEFVGQGRRPNLTRQLLAGAEYLADSGHDRAALTEMVSALEVAINAFARSPRATTLYNARLRRTLSRESLENLVQDLGLRGSVAFLLPLLLPGEEVSTQLLVTCRNAIDERNNIVHRGQRRVEATHLSEFREAVRSLCEILLRFTST
ncbi:MAG: hypothetical protein HY694_02565 [Deltaproteobacteria bacterium]|nr:hypothetical protein [Deltaproteobacteria bacterium]